MFVYNLVTLDFNTTYINTGKKSSAPGAAKELSPELPEPPVVRLGASVSTLARFNERNKMEAHFTYKVYIVYCI